MANNEALVDAYKPKGGDYSPNSVSLGGLIC
jgi:hypothetical protein